LRRLGCLLRDSLGWPAGHQITPVSQVTSVSPRSAQVPSELPCLPSCRSFEAKARLNISEFIPYREENTELHNYKDQLVNTVYSENLMTPICTNCSVADC
jgi:hypothetical protein